MFFGYYYNNCYCLVINEFYIWGLIWVLFFLSGFVMIWFEVRWGVYILLEVVKVLIVECDIILIVLLCVRKILFFNLMVIFLEDCYIIGLFDWLDNYKIFI